MELWPNVVREVVKELPMYQAVVASKPDLCNGQQALAAYPGKHGFVAAGRFAAFVIWERSKN